MVGLQSRKSGPAQSLRAWYSARRDAAPTSCRSVVFMAPLEILPAKSNRFAKNLQLERSLALPAAVFLRNSIDSRALHNRCTPGQGPGFYFQAWLLENRGRCIGHQAPTRAAEPN